MKNVSLYNYFTEESLWGQELNDDKSKLQVFFEFFLLLRNKSFSES